MLSSLELLRTKRRMTVYFSHDIDRPRQVQAKTKHCVFHSNTPLFLDAFAKLRRATFSFIMSVRMEQLGYHRTDFHEI
jgi:hypothetical protein